MRESSEHRSESGWRRDLCDWRWGGSFRAGGYEHQPTNALNEAFTSNILGHPSDVHKPLKGFLALKGFLDHGELLR